MKGQLEELCKNGIDIDLCCGGSKDDLDLLQQRNVGRVINIPMRRHPSPLSDIYCLILLIFHFSRNRYDCIAYSTPKALLLGSIAAYVTAQPRRIAWVRGRAYERMTGLKRAIYECLDKLAIRTSTESLFISKSILKEYIVDGIVRDVNTAHVLGNGSSNGVDTDRFSPIERSSRDYTRNATNIAVDRFVVIVAGRVTKDKGTFDVLELMERLRDDSKIFWLFVGTIEDKELGPALQKLDPLRGRWIPHTSKLEELIAISDLHLFLSHREGFGNVAIEAAACGVPTFGYDIVGVQDSVASGITGELFRFGDLEGLEHAIRTARSECAFSQRYPKARDYVRARFDQVSVWSIYQRFLVDLDH